MNSKTLREVFSQNKPFYKNTFQFIQRCHIFEAPNPSLSPIFSAVWPKFREKVDLTRHVPAEQGKFPSPTPKEKDEPVEKDSYRNSNTQRIN